MELREEGTSRGGVSSGEGDVAAATATATAAAAAIAIRAATAGVWEHTAASPSESAANVEWFAGDVSGRKCKWAVYAGRRKQRVQWRWRTGCKSEAGVGVREGSRRAISAFGGIERRGGYGAVKRVMM